jgi:hypothetical protein
MIMKVEAPALAAVDFARNDLLEIDLLLFSMFSPSLEAGKKGYCILPRILRVWD